MNPESSVILRLNANTAAMLQPVIHIDYEKHQVSLIGGDPTEDRMLADYLRRQSEGMVSAADEPGTRDKPRKTN
jgi:hypothetical protein